MCWVSDTSKRENVPRRKPCTKCFGKEKEKLFSLHLSPFNLQIQGLNMLTLKDSFRHNHDICPLQRKTDEMIFHFKSTFQFNLTPLLVQKHLGHSKTLTCSCLCCHGNKNLFWMDRRVGKQICFYLLETYFLIDNNRMTPVLLVPKCIK